MKELKLIYYKLLDDDLQGGTRVFKLMYGKNRVKSKKLKRWYTAYTNLKKLNSDTTDLMQDSVNVKLHDVSLSSNELVSSMIKKLNREIEANQALDVPQILEIMKALTQLSKTIPYKLNEKPKLNEDDAPKINNIFLDNGIVNELLKAYNAKSI